MDHDDLQKVPSPEVEELSYSILVFERMLATLPGKAGELLRIQFATVLRSLHARDKAFNHFLSTRLDDTLLAIKVMEFDLEATRRERDQFLND